MAKAREGDETAREVSACTCGSRGVMVYRFVADTKLFRVECEDAGCWIGPSDQVEDRARRKWNAGWA